MSTLTSTRSNANADAHRDFDGFDPDEELNRFRMALRAKQWAVAAELAANLDEWLARGGSLPVAWLGPLCMQTTSDHRVRHQRTIDRVATMPTQQRAELVDGYVEVPSR